MYTISFTVMVCVSIAVVGGKLRFLSGRPRDLWSCIFRHSFCFLGANYCDVYICFLRLQQFSEFRRLLMLVGTGFLPFSWSLVMELNEYYCCS